MLSFSLDWNCVIAVENNEFASGDIKRLIELHRTQKAEVSLLQTSASENMKKVNGFPGSYSAFENRLRDIGWEDLPRVSTPAVFGLTFWDHCYIVDGDKYENLRNTLWAILAPNVPEALNEFELLQGIKESDSELGPKYKKWLNAWCDVHSAYSHIEARMNYFVTANTKDFQRNAQKLEQLGLQAVEPKEAIELAINSGKL